MMCICNLSKFNIQVLNIYKYNILFKRTRLHPHSGPSAWITFLQMSTLALHLADTDLQQYIDIIFIVCVTHDQEYINIIFYFGF